MSTEWNLDYVRQTVDYRQILDRLVEHFSEVHLMTGCAEDDMFSRGARKIVCMKKCIEYKESLSANGRSQGEFPGNLSMLVQRVRLVDGAVLTISTAEAPEMATITGQPDDMSEFLNFLDDSWMTEFMAPISNRDLLNSGLR